MFVPVRGTVFPQCPPFIAKNFTVKFDGDDDTTDTDERVSLWRDKRSRTCSLIELRVACVSLCQLLPVFSQRFPFLSPSVCPE